MVITNKMKYLKYRWDEQIGEGEGGDVNAAFVDLLGSITISKTNGVPMDAPESALDVIDYMATRQPATSPTVTPSITPSISMSPIIR